MKKYLLLLGLLIQAVSVLAQETSVGKSMFSVRVGPFLVFGKNDRDHEQLRCLSK